MIHARFKYLLLVPALIITTLPKSFAQIKKVPVNQTRNFGTGKQSLAVQPVIATDGQAVELLVAPPAPGMNVGIIGYRYNEEVPQRDLPAGRGKEEIFTDCQIIKKDMQQPIDAGGAMRAVYSFTVPQNAPSGVYFIAIFPASMSCAAVKDSMRRTDWSATGTLYVTPSYIVSTVESIQIVGNGEEPQDSPSEIAFSFSSLSSKTPGSRTLVDPFSGTYPSTGDGGSNWLTAPDNTTISPDLPIFIGRESDLNSDECNEETKAYPPTMEAGAIASCQVDAPSVTNNFQVAFNGIEYDGSPSSFYGYLAGAAAAAASCYVQGAGCVANLSSNVSLGKTLAAQVNKALHDDDDNFGTLSKSYDFTHNWEIGSASYLPLTEGDNGTGPINVRIANHRIGGPMILSTRVYIKKIRIVEGYDGKDEPNEVFINTNGYLYQNGLEKYPTSKRYPATGSYPLRTNDSKSFGLGEIKVFDDVSKNAAGAIESPLLYLEMSVWEYDSDDQNDLMGMLSKTINLADFLSNNSGVKGQTSDGQFIKTVSQQFVTTVNGYDNYTNFADMHYPSLLAYAQAKPKAQKGKVEITYQVEVTWLMAVKRTFP